MTKYLKKPQAAQYIGVSIRTLSYWMRKRVVPYRKIGRTILFDPVELDAALNRFRVASVGEFARRK